MGDESSTLSEAEARQLLRRTGFGVPTKTLAKWMASGVTRGNDGLNTVVPTGGVLRPWYESARATGPGGLRLTAADLADTAIGNDPNTGASLALHPGFAASPAGDGGAGGLLVKWMAVNPLTVLTTDAGDPTRTWTVANFDLPLFLP